MNITIENKIQQYIQRLYLKKSLENLIVFFLFFAVVFLIFLLVEYFLYLPTSYRTIFFYFVVILSSVWLIIKVLFPIIQAFVPTFQITFYEASQQIGNKNSEIDDRLINLLQLKEQGGSDDLILESITQLESSLFKFDFLQTISFRSLWFLLKLLLIPITFLFIFSVINFDGLILQPSHRIISFNEHFNKPLDFKVEILNDSLTVIQGESFDLKYKITSNSDTPIFIFHRDDIYEANISSNNAIHRFDNVSESFSFNIGKNLEQSYKYNVKVIYPPKIISLSLHVTPPEYTFLPSRDITNLADVIVAKGSKLRWVVGGNNISQVLFVTDSSAVNFHRKDNSFIKDKSVYKNIEYSLLFSSDLLSNYLNLKYNLSILPDEYPKIFVDDIQTDDKTLGIYNFSFKADDDYGLSGYGYKILLKDKVVYKKYIPVHTKHLKASLISIDTRNMNLSGKANVQFFVTDNDKLDGSKTSFSSLFPLYLLSAEELIMLNSITKDSLVLDFSTKLEHKIHNDSLNNSFKNLDKHNSAEKNQLEKLKEDIEKSIANKQILSKKLNSIDDPKLLDEINKAIAFQKELLNQVTEALKNINSSKENQSDKLEKKNDFQQKKTLNLLRKIASNELLKSLSQDSQKLDANIKNLDSQPNFDTQQKLNNQLNQISKKLDQLSKLQNSDQVRKDVSNEMDNLKDELNKSTNSDLKKMRSDSNKLASKLKSKSTISMGGGEGMSVDLETLNKLFYDYLSLSLAQEFLTKTYDLSSSNDTHQQYTLLKNLDVLNSNLYNFALENVLFKRSSFDLIYPLLNYTIRFDEVFEDGNSYKLAKTQRELLSDINSVVDLLSDILEQMQNANPNSSSGDGNDRKQSTPQDLIDQQKQLNSKTQLGSKSTSDIYNSLSEHQISEIIKEQEEIRNKFNELSGGNKQKLNKEVDELKKSLLKQAKFTEIRKHQQNIIKQLKDFKGESKDKDNKRKSTSAYKIPLNLHYKKVPLDKLPSTQEHLSRENLDFNDFYNNKISK